jgi:two-component system LytT family response regulator
LEAQRNYSFVYGNFGSPICRSKNLGHFEQMLDKSGFFRVHHSHLISIFHINKFNKSEGFVEMADGHVLPVSREKKKTLGELLEQLQKHD